MAGDEQKHILVIEESRVLREAMQELLAHEGFMVTAVIGGADARAALEDQLGKFHLIVVNLQLPPAPDFNVLDWLRANRSRVPIPILVVTAPSRMSVAIERLRGLEAAGIQDTRTLWDQLGYRVRALVRPTAGDERAAVRLPSGLPVNCHIGPTCVQGTIGNISRMGMFVKLEAPAPVGEQVLLQFIIPDIPRLFEVRARVVWAARRDQGAMMPGMGVEFLDMDEAGSTQINAYVHLELEKFARLPVP